MKTDILNKTKYELRKLASNFKHRCASANSYDNVSNWNTLLIDTFNAIVNPTFIQHLTSSINRAHSGFNKLKEDEIAQCFKILTVLHFYQVTSSSFLIMIMGNHSLKMPPLALNYGNSLGMVYRKILVTLAQMRCGIYA